MSHHNPFISFGSSFICPTIDNTNSLMFDGVSDYIIVSDSAKDLQRTEAELNSTGFTYNVWVKFDAFAGSEPLLCIGRANNKYYGLGFQVGNNQKCQIHKYGLNGGAAGAGGNNRRTLQMANTISTGVWYMLTFVMGSGSADDWKIYVNGVNQTTSKSGNANVTLTYNSTTNVWIGKQGRTSAEKYHAGNIAGATVWLDTLNGGEIGALYSSGITGDPLEDCTYGATDGTSTPADTVKFHYEINNSTTNTLPDRTLNGHTGFSSGTTWETDTP